MKISILGTGYVGLTVGICLANLGNDIICVDIDKHKIENLKKAILPIYESGLKELLERNINEKRISFTTNIKKGIQNSEVIFIAVGTPPDKDHRADLSFVKTVAEEIGKHINDYKVIVNKSTVPVGTADLVNKIVKEHQSKPISFDVVSNPEFLREGKAIKDFNNPDRIVIGTDSEKAKQKMLSIYQQLERVGKPILITDIKTAELTKYASNSFLATKISFINELSHLSEKVGADIKLVAKGMGLDTRIGPRFLQAGIGYGGSCFPKDVKALVQTMKDNNCNTELLDAVESVNDKQRMSLIPKIQSLLKDIKGKKIAVWGLSFKPDTNDMREAPSVTIINELQRLGASIKSFDPAAMKEAKKILKNVEYAENPYDVLKGCNLLLILTEWDEFRELDKNKIKSSLKEPNIVDGRNLYDPKEMKNFGFNYIGVGR